MYNSDQKEIDVCRTITEETTWNQRQTVLSFYILHIWEKPAHLIYMISVKLFYSNLTSMWPCIVTNFL